jgi:hypothetical protein
LSSRYLMPLSRMRKDVKDNITVMPGSSYGRYGIIFSSKSR